MSLQTTLQCLKQAITRNLELLSLGHNVESVPRLAVADLDTSIVWAKDDDCKKLEERKKLGPVCKSPDLTRKPIPPYQYGFCKEREPEMPMSCPPKLKKRGKGPCCHDTSQKSKGGCKVNT